jgi:hypothetical protein
VDKPAKRTACYRRSLAPSSCLVLQWAHAQYRPEKIEDLISYYATADWVPWAYCKDEAGCGHNVRLDLAAIIARTGDMPADQFRLRLRCSKCVGRGW